MDATRQAWTNLQPLPAKRSTLSIKRSFSEQEMVLIRQGFIPERMEDRWFIFYEVDTLFIHRSWTGFCIYQLHFLREDSGYTIGEVLVNRDQDQYSGSDDPYDERLLPLLIDRLLLKQPSQLSIAANLPVGIATELHLQHVIGAEPRAREGVKQITILGILGWLWWWLIWLFKR